MVYIFIYINTLGWSEIDFSLLEDDEFLPFELFALETLLIIVQSIQKQSINRTFVEIRKILPQLQLSSGICIM